MRVMTFFNEKGGVGKTTLTALFASYLAYGRGESVYVADCDYPSYQLWNMRELDLRTVREDPSSTLARASAGNAFFPTGKVAGRDRYGEAELRQIADWVRRFRVPRQSGVMLLDFPGRYLPGDPICRLVQDGLLDLVVFPVDSDRQSLSAALSSYMDMRQRTAGRQACAFLWNRETQGERRAKVDRYAESERMLAAMGVPVVRTRLRDVQVARRDALGQGFVRNTLCWPAATVARACPWLEDAFEEVVSLLGDAAEGKGRFERKSNH